MSPYISNCVGGSVWFTGVGVVVVGGTGGGSSDGT